VPSTTRPRITVRRRRAAPSTLTDRGPREDVARQRNAIDAAVLVVPCPVPSLSTASQPPLMPQVYGKSRTVVLSRAIDLSRFAGRAAPGPGRAGPGQQLPALHPDGTTACPRPGARRRRLTKGSALSTTHRSLAAACSAARRQRWWGAAAPTRQLLRRGAARRRARAHSEDGWTTVATLSAACGAAGPRAARARSPGPGRAIGRAARKKRDAYWCAGAAAR
jgi:hypothetical protein